MPMRHPRQDGRIAIVSLVLVVLVSLRLQAVSQENEWQFRRVAEHEGGYLEDLGPDMTAFVQQDSGALELYTINVDGDRTRVTRNRRGSRGGDDSDYRFTGWSSRGDRIDGSVRQGRVYSWDRCSSSSSI